MPRIFTRHRYWVPHIAAWLAVALLIAAVWLHVYSLIETDHARAIAETNGDLSNLTRVTQEHAQRTFRNADQALRFIKAGYEAVGDRLDLKTMMAQGVIDAGIFNQVGVIGADGTFRLSNLPINNSTNLSDRAHFTTHIAADTQELFISKPLVGRVTGKWSIQLSRRINRRDGSFGGVAVVSLDLNYFTRFYGDLNLGQRGSMAMLGLDGIIRANRTGSNEHFGIDASSSPLFAHLRQGQQSGTFRAASILDGIERLFFFRQVTPYAIVTVAGIATQDAFAAHNRAKTALLLEASLATLLLLTLSMVFSIYHRRVQRDITERKRAAQQLADSEQRMELALNGADLGLWDWHIPSGEFTHNLRMASMLGYGIDAPEMTSQLFASLLHPDDWPQVRAALHPHLRGETPMFEVVHRLRHHNQQWISLLARGKVVERDAHGRAVRMVGTDLDITEKALAEQQLRIAAAAFESQQGMFVTDAHRMIQRVNRAFTAITGYSAADAVGQTPRMLSSGLHDAAFYAEMQESITCNGSWQGEIWNRRKNGEIYPQWLTITAVQNSKAKISHYVSTLTDITSRKAAENEIRQLAFFDPLTGLPNQRLLLDRVQQALMASERNGQGGALLFVDLDNFKMVNDTLGHDKGDLLLQQVAQRVAACVREGDTVARQGGDEFVVMLENLSAAPQEAAAQAELIGEKILAALNQAYLLADHVYHSTASIGVSLFNHQHNSVEELLQRADLAMYEAKSAGRNALRFFDPDMQAAVTARATLEADLRQALQHRQFRLYYQPQADQNGRIAGAEALLRWQHPQRGLLLPAEFLPLAEESGLILPLGKWVLETACAQLGEWANQPAMAHLTLAINISARQLHQPDFVEQVLATLTRYDANSKRLKLELTEHLLLKDIEASMEKMQLLKACGVQFALDDFGAGYSFLSYLKRLPLDQLKLDLSFVRGALTEPDDAIITVAIVALARSLGLGVIAERVETEAQRQFLIKHECPAYQGTLFSKPLALAEFEQFLHQCEV